MCAHISNVCESDDVFRMDLTTYNRKRFTNAKKENPVKKVSRNLPLADTTLTCNQNKNIFNFFY